MDDVTSKLKKLFKSKPKGFKGSGQKLGSTSQATTSSNSAPARPSQVSQRPYSQQPPVREKPTPPANKQPLGLRSAPPTEQRDVPPASVLTTGAYIAPEEEKATDAQHEAFALLKAAPQRAAAAEVLSKVLRNIVDHPSEAKYRKLKLNNKKVQQAVVNVDGGLELLQASGFELVFDESSPEPQAAALSQRQESASPDGTTSPALSQSDSQPSILTSESSAAAPAESGTTGYLWFPEEAELWLLQAALQLLRPLTPLPFSNLSTGSASSVRTNPSPPPYTGRSNTASLDNSSAPSKLETSAATAPMLGASNVSSSQSRMASQLPQPASSTPGVSDASLGIRSSDSAAQSGPVASAPNNLAEPRPRKTQVLLPAETDAQVPDWVFQQSPAELKQAFMTAKKRREMDSMLMTRAYREKLAGGKTQKGTYIYAVIRVRLPEGLLLQGEFNAREPVTAIFEWVSDCLRDPSSTYELILPTRKPLVTSMGRVSEADLLPSALLNLRFDSPSSRQLPSLHDTLLQQVQ